ncbi:MAG: hypothetical protein P4L31_00050 [Candidatus Babeliales bacterium]|nr:hypothetical protein [Candidatus Babeliales bacterium]
MTKLRVGVFMGGKTIEKEVSFNSGRTVCDHLDTSRYEIIPIYQMRNGDLYLLPWYFLHRGKTTDFEHRLPTQAQKTSWDDLKKLIDFAYIATHGRYAEDGTLQGFFEVLGIPYLGSKVFASALGMNKSMQRNVMAAGGIDIPKHMDLSPTQITDMTLDQICTQLEALDIKPPYIIKPNQEGSSLGMSVVFENKELIHAIEVARDIYPGMQQDVIIQEKIEGMEFSVIILTDYKTGALMPLPPTEIVCEKGTHFYDYAQKYMPGRAMKYTPARASDQAITRIQETCCKVMNLLGITNIARIDGFYTADGRVVIIDPNTLSGMAPASYLFTQAAQHDMSHTAVINHLIETELHNYGMLDAIIAQEKKDALVADNTQKIRVAVLLGGASNEKEISLESGRNITYKLSPQKYDVTPLFVSSAMELFPLTQSQLVRNSTHEIEELLDQSLKIAWNDLPALYDFVFIGLHGGQGENGSVQGTLEMLGMPYNGSSVLASALCMDKFKTASYLRSKGFEVPQSMLIAKNDWISDAAAITEHILTTLPLPVIIKPHDDGCSVLVQKAKNEIELKKSIDTLFATAKDFALIEECIIGMELTVGVIGNNTPQALPPSQAVTTSDILSIEEKFLPGAGENQTPAPLPQATLALVQSTVADAYKALGCKGYSRMDCFYQTATQSPTGKERVVILENNSLPGLTPATCIFHQAAEINIKPMDFIDLIVQLGLEEHKKINPVLPTVQEKQL